MGQLVRIASGAPWEPIVGYSRAVRAGDFVAVSGTTGTEAGRVIGAGQMYVQARQALSNIRTALERMGLAMSDVVRTRMFVTDIARWSDVARAHREFFADHPPAATMVEVRRLVHPDMLIEIEADAYVVAAQAPAARAKLAAAPAARPKASAVKRARKSAPPKKKPAPKAKRRR
jgi:enamine deaminase RidA (YjgF/YER057c/UK114 family)